MAVCCGDSYAVTGSAPDEAWLRNAARWFQEHLENGEVYHSDTPPGTLAPPVENRESFCWMLAGVIHRGDVPAVVICFRGEKMKQVNWAGDPSRPVEVGRDNRLSPRRSFELWRETLLGKSDPWREEDIAFFSRLIPLLRETVLPGSLAASFSWLASEVSVKGMPGSLFHTSLRNGVAILSMTAKDPNWQILTGNARLSELLGVGELGMEGLKFSDAMRKLGAPRVMLHEMKEKAESIDVWSPTLGPRSIMIGYHDLLRLRTNGTLLHLAMLEFEDVTSDQRLADAHTAASDRPPRGNHGGEEATNPSLPTDPMNPPEAESPKNP